MNEGTQQLYNSTTSRQIPDPFIVNSGSFNVIFDSDAIQTDEGFSLTYSVGEILTLQFFREGQH